MTNIPDLSTVQEMHQAYLVVTGTDPRTVPLSLDVRRRWEMLLVNGYTVNDVLLVYKYIMSQRKKRNWSWGTINLNRVLLTLDTWRDWLQQAQAAAREREIKFTPAQRVLKEFRRTEPVSEPNMSKVTTPKEILAGYAKMREAIDGNRV